MQTWKKMQIMENKWKIKKQQLKTEKKQEAT